jgi:hypothetical protein
VDETFELFELFDESVDESVDESEDESESDDEPLLDTLSISKAEKRVIT